jgi:hypothetical protein
VQSYEYQIGDVISGAIGNITSDNVTAAIPGPYYFVEEYPNPTLPVAPPPAILSPQIGKYYYEAIEQLRLERLRQEAEARAAAGVPKVAAPVPDGGMATTPGPRKIVLR